MTNKWKQNYLTKATIINEEVGVFISLICVDFQQIKGVGGDF
jgi:hypothetical protein